MAIYYHQSPRGFYHESIHGHRTMLITDPSWVRPEVEGVPDENAVPRRIEVDNPDCKIPEGAVLITYEQHKALLEGESQGKIISEDAMGFPILLDRPSLSVEQLATVERNWRNSELLATDQIVARHRDERDLAQQTALSDEQFSELLEYRKQLREWPAEIEFPSIEHRPVIPDFI